MDVDSSASVSQISYGIQGDNEFSLILTGDQANNLNKASNSNYTMFPDWVKVMVKIGKYVIVDSTGKRLPASEAVKLIE